MVVVHGKHSISRAMLRNLDSVRDAVADKVNLRILCVMSPADVLYLSEECRRLGICFMLCQNQPVSCKFQMGLDAVHAMYPDVAGFMYAGGDDFITAPYVLECASRVAANPNDCFGPSEVYFLDSESGTMVRWDKPMLLEFERQVPYGIGRCYGRAILDDVRWLLWPFKANKGLDTYSSRWLAQQGIYLDIVDVSSIPGAYLIDVKGDGNLHPFSEFLEGDLLTDERADSVCASASIDRNQWRSVHPVVVMEDAV